MVTADISKAVRRVDAVAKCEGTIKYVSDYAFDDCLWGRLVRSSIPRGIIKAIHLPQMPDGYISRFTGVFNKNQEARSAGKKPAERALLFGFFVAFCGESVAYEFRQNVESFFVRAAVEAIFKHGFYLRLFDRGTVFYSFHNVIDDLVELV